MVGGVVSDSAPLVDQPQQTREPVHLYYLEEGFGAIYRRTMLNDFLTQLVNNSRLRTVAELPLDSYGMVGAGSLILAWLGCDVSLVSDDEALLARATALMAFNGIKGVKPIHASLYNTGLPTDAFDFTWSFDRVQALADPARFLAELCRVSKATMVIVPNARNYGQYAHYVYHRLSRTSCDFVGPRRWMSRTSVCSALKQGGMELVADGFIDVPWWPGFPELPNLIRELIGRAPVTLGRRDAPETDPCVPSSEQAEALRIKVEKASFIERGQHFPGFIKSLFAHNVYVLACKPQYQRELGFSPAPLASWQGGVG